MMYGPRALALTLSLILVALMSVGVTSAAPVNGSNSETFDLDCGDAGTFSVVVPGEGDFTPGIFTEGDARALIPVALSFTVTDEDGNELFSETAEKRGRQTGLQDALITCTFSITFEEGELVLTLAGEVTGFVVPRG